MSGSPVRLLQVLEDRLQKPKMRFTLTRWCLTLFFFLNRPIPVLPATSEVTHPPTIEPEPFLYLLGKQRLLEAQHRCYDRMQKLPPYQGEGLYCNRTWDGWSCWDDTPAGVLAQQHCPDYFPDFDVAEKVTKYCEEDGLWYTHPDSNISWSNYTMCNAFTPEKMQNAYILYYLAIVGHSMSMFTLVISLAIFMLVRSLKCQRVTLHKNMFLTYVLNSIIIIIHLVEVVPNGELVKRDPPICKILHFFHQYMMSCNYFWMLCEGVYLHTLIVVSVFAERQRMWWYYVLGWGLPLVPTTAHAIARALLFNDNCWLSVDTNLLYIIHGPVMGALVINFFFLLNIVRVLVKKMKESQEEESHMYLKAVRATLILVPLLGVQFVVLPWRPSHPVLGRIYDYVMHSLIHFQGFFVAVIYCFCNHEVQAALKRQWNQYQAQRWSGRRRATRAANAAAATAAAAAALAEAPQMPVYICHQEPRNEPTNNLGEEGAEVTAMEGAEVIAMEGDEVIVMEGAEVIAMEIIEQESSA
ncbi:calcitonin receptor isoform X1 [Delphinapterus leucas]|uniref:Calcitonin receptor n=1 Tax=Delphinapterus leucas TaxID=9749 RepID=A0A2Y9PGI2_DELLE|nr:calcitonin receptor isoform X1 [Delphinapterus leucas]